MKREPWCEVAGVVAVVFGTVIALRGWPSGDWEFGWNAVGALFTVFLSGIAAYISYVQKKWMGERREADAQRISEDLDLSLVYLYLTFNMLHIALHDDPGDDLSALQHCSPRLEKAKDDVMTVLRRDIAYLIDKGRRDKVNKVMTRIEAGCFLLGNALTTKQQDEARNKAIASLSSSSESILADLEDALGSRAEFVRSLLKRN